MSTARNRASTRKPRRDKPRPGRVVMGGALVVLVLVVAAVMATRVYNGVPGKKYTYMYLSVPQVGNLLTHDQVRIHGARVGQVMTRAIDDKGQPRIKIQLDPGVKLGEGTQVVFRANGLLGARYIDLRPGDGPPMADGSTIRGGLTSYTDGVPEFLGTFDRETRGGLGNAVTGLGQGLLGQGSRLNDTIHIASSQATNFRDFADTVLAREGAAARLAPALASAVEPLARNRETLSTDNGLAAEALRPFVSERQAVRDTLTVGGPALRAVVPGLGKGTGLVNAVDGLARQLNVTLPVAPSGLRSLHELLTDGREPLTEAQDLLQAALPAAPGIVKITDSVEPVLGKLRTTLADATNILQQVGRYRCDFATFGTSMRSMTGFMQPDVGGPAGPAQAFRLQVAPPVDTDLVGVRQQTDANKRDQVAAPCSYPSKPYQQFNGTGAN